MAWLAARIRRASDKVSGTVPRAAPRVESRRWVACAHSAAVGGSTREGRDGGLGDAVLRCLHTCRPPCHNSKPAACSFCAARMLDWTIASESVSETTALTAMKLLSRLRK